MALKTFSKLEVFNVGTEEIFAIIKAEHDIAEIDIDSLDPEDWQGTVHYAEITEDVKPDDEAVMTMASGFRKMCKFDKEQGILTTVNYFQFAMLMFDLARTHIIPYGHYLMFDE